MSYFAQHRHSRVFSCPINRKAPLGRLPFRKQPDCSTVAHVSSVAPIVDIDARDYVSGEYYPTFLGRVVQGVFPAPVRFAVSIVPALAALLSCHAESVLALITTLASSLQLHFPVVSPIISLFSLPIIACWTSSIFYCLPPVFAFIAVPILDYVLGEEEAQDLGSASRWQAFIYSAVCYTFVALHLAAVVSTAYVASQPHIGCARIALLCVNLGIAGGYAINWAHELIHSHNKVNKFLGQVLLTSTCYKHWGHSHMAHHAQVATDVDPASARYKESVYPFIVRCVSGEWRDAVALEMKRVQRERPNLPRHLQVLHSKIPGWIGWPLATALAFKALFGTAGVVAYLLSGAGSVLVLTVINYVEHYGLTRNRLPCGRYEPVTVHHSWNANHLVSNASLIRLQRHTDHHMNAHKPFYRLENVEGAPRLPADYSTMVLLALIPPAWFCVMNPRVHMYKLLSEVGLPGNTPEGPAPPAPAPAAS